MGRASPVFLQDQMGTGARQRERPNGAALGSGGGEGGTPWKPGGCSRHSFAS